MKTNNYIVLGISAVAAAFLLFLWYSLGFNHVDNPLDLVLAIVWWVGIVVLVALIMRVENNRKRQIRTIYVSPTALYNSERGMVGLNGTTDIAAMQDILNNLEYGFEKNDLPENSKFDYRYVVQTDEFKDSDDEPTWKGTVIKIDRQNGNTETSFESEQELREALAA